ncbi:YbaB/EbfC family nucleoid-associated protein [Olivibacter sitiensis]|uniref:YbaB/EbfC family nucleoid-associated protein n=1 Tax=Olivibacter sitiensis TaxID=376470 RepID=UPI00040565B7|nr:YbaB/EbfC family nucleoid-associated protein [Olivibacter sitiensis]
MYTEKIQAVQNKLAALQKNISETTSDTANDISITLNGQLQVTALVINKQLSIEEVELKLPQLINSTIIKVSAKVQEALKTAIS